MEIKGRVLVSHALQFERDSRLSVNDQGSTSNVPNFSSEALQKMSRPVGTVRSCDTTLKGISLLHYCNYLLIMLLYIIINLLKAIDYSRFSGKIYCLGCNNKLLKLPIFIT